MATTTDDPTVTVTGPDGQTTEPIPLAEIEEHAEAIGQAVFGHRQQLSFDVGGKQPDRSSISGSFDLLIRRQLRKSSQVQVQIIDAHGEVLAKTDMKIVAVNFVDEYKDGFVVGTERVHKVKSV